MCFFPLSALPHFSPINLQREGFYYSFYQAPDSDLQLGHFFLIEEIILINFSPSSSPLPPPLW